MPERFDDLKNKKYDSIVDFMRGVTEAGFENDIDNGRVMRALNEKFDEIWSQNGRQGSCSIRTSLREHPKHKFELVATLFSDIDPTIRSNLILFVRAERNSLAISRDILEDTIHINRGDLPYSGVTLSYFEAERVLREKNRFNDFSIAAFTATYTAIAAVLDGKECVLKVTPMTNGFDVKYMVNGEQLTSVLYIYTK